jgi:hypothetical protein
MDRIVTRSRGPGPEIENWAEYDAALRQPDGLGDARGDRGVGAGESGFYGSGFRRSAAVQSQTRPS